jgi:phosphatidylglycerophosphate synthase
MQLVRDDRRVTARVRWRPIREFPLDDCGTWEVLAQEIGGPCLILSAQMVFSRQLLETLLRQAETQPGALAVVCDGHVMELAVLPPRLLRGSTAISGEGMPVHALLASAQALGCLVAVETSNRSPAWCLLVHDEQTVRAAERQLLRSLRGQYEGFVDTYFNRAISAWLTRLFLTLRLSPNAVTMVAMGIGMLAALAFARGGYAAGVVGAVLFQLAAIIDCCDGEVARLTFTESALGAQLDLFADNVVHMAVFAGIGIGAFHAQAGLGSATPWLPLALSGTTVLANLISLWLVARAKAIGGQGQWRDPAQAARVDFVLRNIASRDFSVVLLVFAVIGQLSWFLWLTAIGANLFWVLLAWVTRPSTVATGIRA